MGLHHFLFLFWLFASWMSWGFYLAGIQRRGFLGGLGWFILLCFDLMFLSWRAQLYDLFSMLVPDSGGSSEFPFFPVVRRCFLPPVVCLVGTACGVVGVF